MASAALELVVSLKDQASSALGGLRETIGGLGPAVAGVGLVAGGALVAGFGAAGKAAFDFASEAAQAQRDVQAQLGISEEDARGLGDVARNVFVNNWGGSISEATQMTAEARKQLGELNNTDLGNVTQGAAAISDTFEGADYAKVINSVRAIRDNFPGTTEAQALDLITKGFQNGLDVSGDFLDSIGEYSNQFGSGGASVDQFFGLLDSGLGSGILGTDKIADAFKEFNVRILDGSQTTQTALSTLGLDNLLNDLNSGKITAADAMGLIVEQLGTVDEATRRQTGVALLGTQFEDLGFDVSAFAGIAGSTFANVDGATASLNARYASFGSLAEGAWRQFLVAMEPVGAQLLEIANAAMPQVQAAIGWLGTNLPPIIAAAVAAITALYTQFLAILPAVQPVIDLIGANLLPILAVVAGVLAGVVVASIASAVAAFLSVAAPIAAMVAIGAALVAAWQSNFGGIQTITATVMTAIQTVISTVLAGVLSFWQANGAQIMTQTQTIFSSVQAIVSNVMQILGAVIAASLLAIVTFWQTNGATIQSIAMGLWNVVAGLFQTGAALLQGITSALLAVMRGDWQGAGQAIQSMVQGMWGGLQQAFNGGRQILLGSVQLLISGVQQAFGGLASQAVSLGSNIINGIISGVRSGVAALASAVRSAAQSALDAAKSMLGINSPSLVFQNEVGGNIVAGLAQGLKDGESLLARAGESLAAAATPVPQLATSSYGGGGGGGFGGGVQNSYAGATVSITINAAPGQSERSIADAVSRELGRQTERRQR